MDDLKRLARLATRATQGMPGERWYVLDGRRVSATEPCEPVEDCGYNSNCVALCYGSNDVSNAAYIAAANPEVVLRLVAIAIAAQTYYEGYAQDEAEDGSMLDKGWSEDRMYTGCSRQQAEDAFALREALGVKQ